MSCTACNFRMREKTMDNNLNFPIILKGPLPPSLRSMDEINEWIEQDYDLFFDRAIYEKEKLLYSVNIPFVL